MDGEQGGRPHHLLYLLPLSGVGWHRLEARVTDLDRLILGVALVRCECPTHDPDHCYYCFARQMLTWDSAKHNIIPGLR